VGELKRLITEPTLTIEPKAVDPFSMSNCLHIIMASNEDWVVPAGMDARRFAVMDVSSQRMGDKAYFKALWAEMEEGGTAAMLHDLLSMDLRGWHPRDDIPQTEALLQQKMESLKGVEDDTPARIAFALAVLLEGPREHWSEGTVNEYKRIVGHSKALLDECKDEVRLQKAVNG
jgi:hypothetical protein